jgi:L-lactate dehydrogenase complex protein LldF
MEKFWPSLKCIRCAACMNTCPVYRRSGGLSYGSTYMGPIGIIIHDAYDHPHVRDKAYSLVLSGPSGSADIGGITVHPAQGVMTLTVIFWPRAQQPKSRTSR